MGIKSFALLVVVGVAYQAMPQDVTTSYPNMAPIEQYLMDRTAEITLARSAAPESISRDAEVLVLGRHGFETAVEGKNGWVCMVERGWGMFDWPEFWNPKIRAANCLNPQAARSIVPLASKRTELLPGRPFQGRGHRRNQGGTREERIASSRAGSRVLHDGQVVLSYR